VLNEAKTLNSRVSAKIKELKTGRYIGVASRITDAGFYCGVISRYDANNKGGKYWGEIAKYDVATGVLTPLQFVNIPAPTGDLRLETVGNSIQLYLNESKIAEVQDNTYSTEGNVGIFGYGGKLDDFDAKEVGSLLYSKTLTFDSPVMSYEQDGYGKGGHYYEGEFVSTTSGLNGAFIRFKSPYSSNMVPDSGSVHVGTTYGCVYELERIDGKPFNLESLRFGEYSLYARNPAINIQGIKADGSVVFSSFNIDFIFDGPGGVEDYQLASFGPEFKDVVKVKIPTEVISFDDVKVSWKSNDNGQNLTVKNKIQPENIYSNQIEDLNLSGHVK